MVDNAVGLRQLRWPLLTLPVDPDRTQTGILSTRYIKARMIADMQGLVCRCAAFGYGNIENPTCGLGGSD